MSQQSPLGPTSVFFVPILSPFSFTPGSFAYRTTWLLSSLALAVLLQQLPLRLASFPSLCCIFRELVSLNLGCLLPRFVLFAVALESDADSPDLDEFLALAYPIILGDGCILLFFFSWGLEWNRIASKADNAGFDATDLLNRLRQKHARDGEAGKWFGVDVDTEGEKRRIGRV